MIKTRTCACLASFASTSQQGSMADLGNDYIANSADPKNVQDLTVFVSI